MRRGGTVDKAGVDRWLRAYVEAWKSYDTIRSGELFAEDVQYVTTRMTTTVPAAQRWCGRGWVRLSTAAPRQGREAAPTTPSTGPVAVDGDVAGGDRTQHLFCPGRTARWRRFYDNCFVMRFDGRGPVPGVHRVVRARPGGRR